MVQFTLDFLGTTVVDKLFSNPMVPWVIADVKKRKKIQKVNLAIENGEIIGKTEDVVIFRHKTQNLHRFCIEPNNMRTFMYLLRDEFEPVLNVYLFQTSEFEDVVEIFQTMRESTRDSPNMTKSHSSAAALTSLCPGISPTNSQFFEVLYVGKMKVSHRKVPETFIDDALERIRLFELEKSRKLLEQIHDENEKTKALEAKLSCKNSESAKSCERSESINSISDSENAVNDNTAAVESDVAPKKNEEDEKSFDKKTSGSTESESVPDVRINRSRAGSLGVIETFRKKVDDTNQNRTMLFYVGRSDLRLISPDRKQVLLHKMLRDINCCIQVEAINLYLYFNAFMKNLKHVPCLLAPHPLSGIRILRLHLNSIFKARCRIYLTEGVENNHHFGIISREADSYVGYVFKCESDSVAEHIVSAISQSFQSMKENKDRQRQPVLSCEHCPMVWFHKLCTEIEGVNEKKTQLTILKKIESLPEHEQCEIHTKFLGAESSDIKEQNEFLMILLRTHCERKQSRHVHDSAETRSEFLNQVLGGNTIFMKAKRSLTSSFDQLLKRKGSQTDIFHSKESASRKSDSVINECGNDEYQRSYLTVGPSDGEIMRKEISKHMLNHNSRNENDNLRRKYQNSKTSKPQNNSEERNSSFPDIAAITINNQKIEKALRLSPEKAESPESETSKTPMINMFLKVGSTSKTPPQNNAILSQMNQTPCGSWRQAIFNRVVTPGKTDEFDEKTLRKKTKEELRELWRNAINQQILLIRMEKENARLKARQEEATVKRIKLEYDELGSCGKDNMGIWDLISAKDNRISSKCDNQILIQAVRQGVPRARRGEVWHFFAVQYCLKQPPFDSTGFSNYDVPYEDLLKQLTSFQHAILIDLGRTFPSHPYFSSPLGPGQLSLFNLLKGYSLLDSQVGYCQGLSFVAGVLLLHMSEDSAFLLLRHLMFRRGLRKQYLPDMAALQVQLYQLSRLIHDTFPKLYAHFDKNEIAPTLYATSWMLTLFASQFPLGFVTRVFDLLFMEQTLWTEVLFRVIMAILDQHKEALLTQSTFEEIMEYLKNDVPKMDAIGADTIIKKAISLDITKQLHEYEVEYHVLQEEMSTPRPEIEQLRKIKSENRKLTEQNLALVEQLEVVTKNLNRVEKLRFNQQSTINKLETKVKSLEIAIATLGDFILEITEDQKDLSVPGDIRRLIANLETLKLHNGNQKKNEAKKPVDKSGFFKKVHSSIDFYEKPHFTDFCISENLPNGTKHADESKNEKHDSYKSGAIKGVPLKVIVDDDDLNDEKKRTHQNSPTLTSKITSGVSSFFNASHNQIIKNQKNHKKFENPSAFNSVFKSDEILTNNIKFKNNFSPEIGSLYIKEPAVYSHKKETEKNLGLSNLSSCDEIDTITPVSTNSIPSDNSSEHFHPLDTCSDVNITYNGTTKLKSLKSGQKFMKNNAVDLISVNNGLLHISKENSPTKENTPAISAKAVKVTFNQSF